MNSCPSAWRLAGTVLVLGSMIFLSDCRDITAQDKQPDPAASLADLEQQVLKHRAMEAVIWGMPAVNRDLMYQAMLRETKGRDNQMLYWSRLLD